MAPTTLKGYESALRELGYAHNWKLVKDELPNVQEHRCPNGAADELSELYRALAENTKRPLCQNVDIIIPNDHGHRDQVRFKQFLEVLGAPCTEQHPSFLDTVTAKTDSECLAEINTIQYEEDHEKRHDHIAEFIKTERSYVNTLRTIVELIARKLNPQTREWQGGQPIIDRFEHKKLFLNMEEILETNERFMSDLEKCNAGAADGGVCFGEVCASHIVNFECYRYYALNYSFAHNLHLTLSKNNSAYRKFLDICYKDSRFSQRSMIELLSEPVQRITRYTMMIKGILNYTSPQHRDYIPLTRAYVKACGIASMADDDATKLATTCHVLQQSVKNAPCSLVNQNRSFIAHLDADEIHRVKGKPKRPVTMFLFADKLMIAERPNYSCRGIDLCDNGKSQDSFPMWNLKRDPMLKFRGWIDIEQVQIFEGAPDAPNSFILFASDTQKQEYSRSRGPAPTTESHEDYFRRGLRLFSVTPRDDNDQESLQRTAEFVNDFQKAQALAKRYGANDQSYHRLWCESNVYSNIYDTTSYTRANYKHNMAVVYVEEGKSVNLRPLFRGGSTAPWIVALVLQAAGRQGFRYHIWSKIPLHPSREILESIPLAPKQVNVDGKTNHFFGCVFWNNVFLCERHLRASDTYTHAHREELEVKPRSRSRSRSLTRSTSIPTLPGWLGGGNGSQRSRSMSPSRGAVKPASSRSSPINGGGSHGGKLSFSKKSIRSRSSSMTSSSSGNTLARSLTKSTSSSTTATTTTPLLDHPHYQPYQKQTVTTVRPSSKLTQRKSLPPSLCLPSEPILPRPIVSSPQEDFDLANSRPSSRSSTRSSTSFNHAFANGPFSNSVSLASHSTRSSLSLEDLEMAKHSPSPPPPPPSSTTSASRMFPETSEDVARKLQQLLGTSMNNNTHNSKRTSSRPVLFSSRDERPNGFVVSSVGNNDGSTSGGGASRSTQVMDKCRMLTEQMTQLTASVQSRAAHDSGYDVRRFNSNELEEIKMSLGHYRNERRASQPPPPPTSQPPTTATGFDPESFLARKIKQAHAERDFLDRSTNDFKSRVLAEFGRQQL